MSQSERGIIEQLAEIRDYGDLDLWEEVAAKINDALVVYRRAMRARTVKFSDGRIGNLCDMAFSHAYAEVFGEPDEDVS